MGKANFSDAFKRDPASKITERGYPVSEVSKCLDVSTHSLYTLIPAHEKTPGFQTPADTLAKAVALTP